MKKVLTTIMRACRTPLRAPGFCQLVICLAFILPAVSATAITLVSGGTTNYVIATKTGCSSEETYAATDLQSYIQQMSGVTIPINSYANLAACPTYSIVIGSLITSPTLTLEQTEMKVVSNQKLYLRGGNSGSAQADRYAVFYFLEKVLGCRFYSPTYEYVPTLSTITVVNTLNDTHTPSYDYRYIFAQDLSSDTTNWCLKNRLRGAVSIDGSEGNATGSIVTWAQYGATHPEYFPLHGGVRADDGYGWLCWSNPDLPQIFANWVIAEIATHDANTVYEIAQGDEADTCECAPCQAQYTLDQSWSGPMIKCLNAAIAIVHQTYPNAKILTMAYEHTVYPPAVTVPDPKLIIELTHWKYCDLHAVNACAPNAEFQNYLTQWDAITTGNLWVWHYLTNFKSQAAPWPNVTGLVPDIQNYAAHGVTGMFDQGVYWGHGMDLAWLKYWLLAQSMWDTSLNATTLYNDFVNGYYGNASTNMNNYIQLLETNAANIHCDGIFGTLDGYVSSFLPPSVMTQADAYFDAAESTALLQGQAWYDRVRYDRYTLLYAHTYKLNQLFRITSPSDVLTQLGDYNYYTWADEFKNVVGSRGCGNEFQCDAAARATWQYHQGGEVLTAENNKIKLSVAVGVQGQTISLIDKTTGKELLHKALLSQNGSTGLYPFNGGVQSINYQEGYIVPFGQVPVSGTLTTDGNGNQIITVKTQNGIGAWTPQTPQIENTRVFTLPPNNATSFTITEDVHNIGTQYFIMSLEERLMLGGDRYYTTVTATKPDTSTQVITTFPTTLNVTKIDYDNTQYGIRVTQNFNGTYSATIGKNDIGSYNTLTSKGLSSSVVLTGGQNAQLMNETWTLTPITADPLPGDDVVWTDFRNTYADTEFGSHLSKNAGGTGYNADAVSTQTIAGDGWVECDVPGDSQEIYIGLAPGNVDDGTNIAYAIYVGGNRVQAMESAIVKGASRLTTAGDRIRIERIGTTIYYKKNGVTFYTSTTPSTGTLMVDCSVYFQVDNAIRHAKIYSGASPVVTLTAPANNAVVTGTVTLTATASVTGGTISRVDFYDGATLIGTDASSPYSYSWTNAANGPHKLFAKAVGTVSGKVTSSYSAGIDISKWDSADIGTVGVAGSSSWSNGTFTVAGAGAGITGTADAFRFVSQSISGDFTLTARVASFTSTQTNARAGVMVRETTAAGSKEMSTLFKPRSTIQELFTRRTAANGTTATTAVTGAAAPQWVRIVRSGNNFTSFKSADGITWTPIGTAIACTMTNPVQIGLAVTSGTTASTTTATFDNVQIVRYQDDFTGTSLSPNWTPVTANNFTVHDGCLYPDFNETAPLAPYGYLYGQLGINKTLDIGETAEISLKGFDKSTLGNNGSGYGSYEFEFYAGTDNAFSTGKLLQKYVTVGSNGAQNLYRPGWYTIESAGSSVGFTDPALIKIKRTGTSSYIYSCDGGAWQSFEYDEDQVQTVIGFYITFYGAGAGEPQEPEAKGQVLTGPRIEYFKIYR